MKIARQQRDTKRENFYPTKGKQKSVLCEMKQNNSKHELKENQIIDAYK